MKTLIGINELDVDRADVDCSGDVRSRELLENSGGYAELFRVLKEIFGHQRVNGTR